MRKYVSSISICTILFTLFLLNMGCGSHNTQKTQTPIRVEIQDLKAADYQMEISYSGTVEESVSVPLSFSVPGMVERVLVSEGQTVKKGQLLATINGENYKNMYEAALAKQKQAEDAYKRFEPMFKNATMPEIKIVEIQTAVKQSSAASAIAKKNWDDCKLTAPSDGVIGKRSIEPGVNTIPGSPVFNLVQIKKVFVRFPVPENEVSQITRGQMAEIVIPALGKELFKGKVEEIGVIANALSRSYDAKIGLDNPLNTLRPGMVGNVKLVTEKTSKALVVPNMAVLVDENGDNFVYVADINRNKAVKRKVTVGPLLKEGICITEGLQLNEKVVVSGTQKLTDNCAISIVH